MARKPIPNFEQETVQVERARAREEVDRDNELLALRELLADPRALDFFWRFMVKTNMFADPMQANFGAVGHALGWAAAGKWMMSEIVEADPNAWLEMQRRHYLRQIEAAGIAAAEKAREQAGGET